MDRGLDRRSVWQSFRYVVEFTAADDGGTDYRLRDPIERLDTGVAPT